MILTCPACSTRYVVDPSSLGSTGRVVRCARCSHSWMQTLPEDLPPRPKDLAPPPETVQPIPAGSNLPAPRVADDRRRVSRSGARRAAALWVLAGLVATGLGAAAWAGRGALVEAWPASARLYEALGLPVDIVGAGLELRNVRSERLVENGAPVLAIQGQIANISEQERPVPALRATALGPERQALAEWSIDPARHRLAPGEVATFESTLPDPDDAIAEIAITFGGK